jgi:hypothetical protein
MNKSRRFVLALLALVISVPSFVHAQGEKKKQHPAAEDIMDHRTMAEAHRRAAECLEAGKPEKECRAQLSKDCKGVGIGKHCGMKDRHKH